MPSFYEEGSFGTPCTRSATQNRANSTRANQLDLKDEPCLRAFTTILSRQCSEKTRPSLPGAPTYLQNPTPKHIVGGVRVGMYTNSALLGTRNWIKREKQAKLYDKTGKIYLMLWSCDAGDWPARTW